MDSSPLQFKSNWWGALQTSLVLLGLILAPMTSPSPVRDDDTSSDDVVSEDDTWLMMAEEGGRSHLLMWMMTEKQLIPRLHVLTDSATSLLRCTCAAEGGMGAGECLALAESLPAISGLSDIPSQKVVQNENKKNFIKRLLANGHQSLMEVVWVLRSGVSPEGLGQCGGSPGVRHFLHSAHTALAQLRNVMTSFYKSRVSMAESAVTVAREQFASERLLAIRMLYEVAHRLNQISSALEYSVQFSWFNRINAALFNKGRRSAEIRKIGKNKNVRHRQ